MFNPNNNGNIFDTSNIGQGIIGQTMASNSCRVEVMAMYLQETGTYSDMYQHNFKANLSHDNINDIVTHVARNNLNTGGTGLAGLASSIIDVDMRTGSNIHIPNGWGSKRFRFILQTRETSIKFPGVTYYTYLQGFSDFMDVSIQTSQINPDTSFFINSFIRIQENVVSTPNGPQLAHRIQSQGQLLNGTLVATQSNTGLTHFLRPMDIYGKVQTMTDSALASSDVIDLRNHSLSGSQSVMNNYMNNTPTHYLSRMLSPFTTGLKQDSHSPGFGNVYDVALGHAMAQEPSTYENPMINLIERNFGRPGSPFFSLKELSHLDPSVGQRIIYTPTDPNCSNGLATRGVSAEWNNSLPETTLATKLVNVIPGVLWSNYVGMASFGLTNKFGSGRCDLSMEMMRFLTVYAPPEAAANFCQELQEVISRDISYNNQILFDVKVNVSILGDIQLNVSVNGSQPMLYVAPAFSSGTINPMYSHDTNSFNHFAQGMYSVASGLETLVNDAYNNASPVISQGI